MLLARYNSSEEKRVCKTCAKTFESRQSEAEEVTLSTPETTLTGDVERVEEDFHAERAEVRSVALQKEITKKAWAIPYDSISLESVIGAGGSGQVYKGRFGDTTVAVKLLISVLMECEVAKRCQA